MLGYAQASQFVGLTIDGGPNMMGFVLGGEVVNQRRLKREPRAIRGLPRSGKWERIPSHALVSPRSWEAMASRGSSMWLQAHKSEDLPTRRFVRLD